MPATKTSRVPVAIDKPLYEQIRKEAKRQTRKIRDVTNIVLTEGFKAIDAKRQSDPEPSLN